MFKKLTIFRNSVNHENGNGDDDDDDDDGNAKAAHIFDANV